MHDTDIQLRALAATQHGLATVGQAGQLGLGTRQINHRLSIGAIDRLSPRVLRIAGSPSTERQALLATVLQAGRRAAASHSTALALWGVRGFVQTPIHVVRHRDTGDSTVRGATVHEVRSLPDELLRTLDGIPVVAPALALLQLAGMPSIPVGKVARAIDAAWSDRIVSYRSLRAVVDMMSKQGRRGLAVLRALVEERGPAYVPPASNLEARFGSILERAGLPPMCRQVDTADGEGWIGRVDFRDAALPVIAEIQSERFHRGLTAERADAERMARLRAAGFEVVEVTDVDVFHRPEHVVAAIDAARGRARARRAA